jgi:hypothetical protein
MLLSDKKTKTPLFSFQKLNKYFLMPFFVPIICFTTKFFSETMKTDGGDIDIEDVTTDNAHTFVFLYQIIQSLCLFLGGLLYFVTLYTSRSKRSSKDIDSNYIDTTLKEDDSVYTTEMKLINKRKNLQKEKKSMTGTIIIIIIMPLLFICYNLGIGYGVKHPQLEKRVYFLLFITLFNIFIFKKQIFSHQKLSLVITFIGIIPIYLAFGLYLKKEEYYIKYDILLFIGSFSYSLYLVCIKYITQNKGMSVFLLLLYQGLLSFAYTLILYAIISFIKHNNFEYISNIFHCNETNYICVSHFYFKIIMYFILNTVLQVLIFLVVYIFSPELFVISDIFSPLFSFIAVCIDEKEDNVYKIFLTVLGYLIIAIGAFIYNEIIVCNFCGLNENTWKAIDQKAYNDILHKETKESFPLGDKYRFSLSSNNSDDDYENKNKEDQNINIEMS